MMKKREGALDTGVKTSRIGKAFEMVCHATSDPIRLSEINEAHRLVDLTLRGAVEPVGATLLQKAIYHYITLRVKGTVEPVGVRIAKVNQLLKAAEIPFRVDLWSKRETRGWTLAARVISVEDFEKQQRPTKRKLWSEDRALMTMSRVFYIFDKRHHSRLPELLQPEVEITPEDHKIMAVVLSKMMGLPLYEIKHRTKETKEWWRDAEVTAIDLARIGEAEYKQMVHKMHEIGDFDRLQEWLKSDPAQFKTLLDLLPSVSPNTMSRQVYLKQFWNAMLELTS